MKVVLIRTPSVIAVSELRPGCSPPLGLAYIAAELLEAGHEVSVVDAIGEALDSYSLIEGVPDVFALGLPVREIPERVPRDADLIAVTCMFSTEWPMAKRVIQACRRAFPNLPIIAGGEHVTACPDYVMQDCPELNFCGLGEGERLMSDFARALGGARDFEAVSGLVYRRGGEVVSAPHRDRVRDVDSFPWPAWHLFPLASYIEHSAMPGVEIGRSMPILASRGCPYECTFCSNPVMWGRLWKPREPERVFEEMRHWMRVYDVTNFDFFDLTAIVRKDWILAMSRLIIASGLKLTWQLPSGTRSEALDREVVEMLYASGCRNVIYAPESGSETTLKRIKKKISKPAMARSVSGAVRAGIKTKANFIVGFPGETLAQVFESYAYAARLAAAGLHDVSFFPFSPYPGSEFFRELKATGRVRLSEDYFFGLVTNRASFSDHLPSFLLPVLAILGMALFYAVSFCLHPARLFTLLKALWTRRPETRLESALIRLIKRTRTRHSGLAYLRRDADLPSGEPQQVSR